MDKYQSKAQELYAKEQDLKILIEGLEKELADNPVFQRLEQYREELANLWTPFKQEVKEDFIKNDLKVSNGDFGKITLVSRAKYKITDQAKVPKKFLKTSLDETAIKKEYELFHKEIDGVERVVSSSYILVTPSKKDGESS